MIYKYESLKEEYEKLIPPMKLAMHNFDEWLVDMKYPQLTFTEIYRPPDANAKTYLDLYMKLKAGEHPATAEQARIAMQVKGMTDEQLLEKARGRQTWHSDYRAVDIRSREFSSKQLENVVKKLHRLAFSLGYGLEEYELLVHDVTGPHIHFALKPRST